MVDVVLSLFSQRNYWCSALLFNLAWLVAVLYGNVVAWLVLPWLVLFLMANRQPTVLLRFLLLATAAGVMLDHLLLWCGVLVFAHQTYILPFWLWMVWLAFAISLKGYLSWLSDFTRLQMVLGAVAGPLSYWAGAKLGAVSVGFDLAWALGLLALLWAFGLPLLFKLSRCYQEADYAD